MKVPSDPYASNSNCAMRTHQPCRDLQEYEAVHQWCGGCQIRIGIHLIHNDGCADSDEVKVVAMVERLDVPVARRSAGCITCSPTERNTTNFGFNSVFVDE